MKIGVDARKILRNATGLGNYGRTLVCNMSELIADNDRLLLFSPDEGKPALKAISIPQKGELVVPTNSSIPFYKRWWQLKGMSFMDSMQSYQRVLVRLFLPFLQFMTLSFCAIPNGTNPLIDGFTPVVSITPSMRQHTS